MALTMGRQFMEAVNRSKNILVTFRTEWSKDAAAAALALDRVLTAKGKRVEVVADGFQAPKSLAFLPGIADIKSEFTQLQRFVISLDVSRTKIDELSYDMQDDKLRIMVAPKAGMFEPKDVATAASEFKYDLIITVDTPDYASLGALYTAHTDLFFAKPTVTVDHEPANEHYGNINVVDLAATSACEVVYDLLTEIGDSFLDEEVATLLLAGMIAKTKSFKTANVTPKTLKIASELVSAGARRDEIVQNLFRTRSLQTLKLWGRALARLKYDAETKCAWSLLVRQDFIHAGAKEEYLADVVDELIANAPEAEIIALLYEQESPTQPGQVAGVCALVSSERHADALRLVESLRPEGHRRMARVCFPNTSIMDAERTIMEAIAKSLGKRPKAGAAASPALQLDATKTA